jgi:hypothetical protein
LRRAARKAAAKNAKLKAQLPLFLAQVELATAEEEYWRWRRNVSRGSENQAVGPEQRIGADRLLDSIQGAFLRHLAKAIPQFPSLDAYRWRVYPGSGSGYGSMFWKDVLTGRRVVLRYEVIDGRLIEAEVWPPEGWTPPFTHEQLLRLLTIPKLE